MTLMNERCEPDFERARRLDPFGQPVHEWLATAFLFTLAVSTALSAVAFGALTIFTILRLPKIHACYRPLLRTPMAWLTLSWLGWCALTLLWSLNPGQGLDELGAARHVLLPVLFWPVLGRRTRLIAALLAGVLLQNCIQVLHVLEITDLMKHGANARTGGLLHPIQTGVFCGVAICWYLPYIVHQRSPKRWLSLAPAAAAFIGLILTGSRGPWLATLIAVPVELALIFVRRSAARRSVLVLAAAGLLVTLAGAVAGRGMIVPRLQDAAAEYHAAVDEGDYGTSVGLRIGLWSWAWGMFRERPLVGHGLGSFRTGMIEQPSYRRAAERWPERAESYMQRDHAHSTYLHLLAVAGLPGAMLFVSMLMWTLIAAWRVPLVHPFDDGLLAAVILWMVTVQFDALHLNGHMMGLLFFLVTLALPAARPRTEHQ